MDNVKRFVVALVALIGLTAVEVRADQPEQVISYVCNQTSNELRIQTMEIDYDTVQPEDAKNEARWLTDRSGTHFPILKECVLAGHSFTTVVTRTCSPEQGGSVPQVQVFVGADVKMEKDGNVVARDKYWLSSARVPPIVSSRYFGGWCSVFAKPPSFSEIVIHARHDGTFKVEMK